MLDVAIRDLDPRRFAELIGAERAERLAGEVAGAARALVGDRAVINVNSTASGGGVAEMLPVLLGYARGAGIDARWYVVAGDPRFFAITKRIHNHLYGGDGDGGTLGEAEADHYHAVMADNATLLAAKVRPGDVVILHDPQTAGLARHVADLGCRVAWRCHVGIDEQNEASREAWAFLREELEPWVDHYVFTERAFVPEWVPEDRTTLIWPSIDPFSPKNQHLDDTTVEAILTRAGIVTGRDGDTSFTRADGTAGEVVRGADVIRTGPPPDPGTRLVVQVSRWDVMKDMAGVMTGFVDHVSRDHDAQLLLVGPSVSGVTDDPEGLGVLTDCWNRWRDLSQGDRERVSLVCLPMEDLDENAAIVNALQRHAHVVVQKSLAEGFGLTVAEAMLKQTPVGGIVDQVIDGETGLLVENPLDLAGFGRAVDTILADDALHRRLADGAHRRAVDLHLGDTHLGRWFEVLQALVPGGDG